jgi:hypothetical protein
VAEGLAVGVAAVVAACQVWGLALRNGLWYHALRNANLKAWRVLL